MQPARRGQHSKAAPPNAFLPGSARLALPPGEATRGLPLPLGRARPPDHARPGPGSVPLIGALDPRSKRAGVVEPAKGVVLDPPKVWSLVGEISASFQGRPSPLGAC